MDGAMQQGRRGVVGLMVTAALSLAACSTSKPPAATVPTTRLAPAPQRVVAGSVGSPVYPADAPSIRAGSAIMIDASTGRTIYQKHADAVGGAASTQKLLTALVVIDSGNLGARARVSAADTYVEPSKLGVRAGDSYTRHSLLSAFLIKSSNDVAMTLARDNAGSIPAFSARMNSKARSLGAMRSNFANPHGLTEGGQYSCARDVARISYAAYRNPTIRDIVRRKYYTFTFNNGTSRSLENTNELLGKMAECNGMKTGYTKATGRCLVSSAKSGSKEVILVQLRSQTKYIFNDAQRMMSWGLSRL